jgi:hypothetical protein
MTLKVRFPHREVLDLVGILQENTFCFVARACLGKAIVSSMTWRGKGVFSPHRAATVVLVLLSEARPQLGGVGAPVLVAHSVNRCTLDTVQALHDHRGCEPAGRF